MPWQQGVVIGAAAAWPCTLAHNVPGDAVAGPGVVQLGTSISIGIGISIGFHPRTSSSYG
jgi:hypothetical protein